MQIVDFSFAVMVPSLGIALLFNFTSAHCAEKWSLVSKFLKCEFFLFLSQKKSPVTVVKQRPEAKHSQKSVLTAMLMCNVQCQTESKNLIVQRALAALTLSCCDQF